MTTIDFYLTMRPDWSGGIEATRTWRTSIQQAVTGSETRSALFSVVRRGWAYKIQALGISDLAWLKKVLWRDMHLIVGIPIWTDGVALTDSVDAGLDLILPVTSLSGREFGEVGTEAILIDSENPDHWEAVAMDFPAWNDLYLLDAVTGDWPAGTMVYPVAACRIEPAQTIRALTAGVGEFTVNAVEDIGVWTV